MVVLLKFNILKIEIRESGVLTKSIGIIDTMLERGILNGTKNNNNKR